MYIIKAENAWFYLQDRCNLWRTSLTCLVSYIYFSESKTPTAHLSQISAGSDICKPYRLLYQLETWHSCSLCNCSWTIPESTYETQVLSSHILNKIYFQSSDRRTIFCTYVDVWLVHWASAMHCLEQKLIQWTEHFRDVKMRQPSSWYLYLVQHWSSSPHSGITIYTEGFVTTAHASGIQLKCNNTRNRTGPDESTMQSLWYSYLRQQWP